MQKDAKGKYGDVVGKAFGRYRRALPLQEHEDSDEVLDFGLPLLDLHAFRHFMATWLIDSGVPQPVAEELLGHRSEARRTAFARYDHGRALEQLKEAIDQVEPPFDPVELREARRGTKPRVRVKSR